MNLTKQRISLACMVPKYEAIFKEYNYKQYMKGRLLKVQIFGAVLI